MQAVDFWAEIFAWSPLMIHNLLRRLSIMRIERRGKGYAAAFGLMAIALLLMPAHTASAAIENFEAYLDGLQVVAPNASPAVGAAALTLDSVSGAVTINSGTYQDLLGGAINNVTLQGLAPPGINAGTLIFLTLDTPGATTGTFSGGGVLDVMGIGGMQAGNTYIVVRSSVFPGGEIRGQIYPAVPETGSIVLAICGVLGLTAGRRRVG
jgi:hypothetical protein